MRAGEVSNIEGRTFNLGTGTEVQIGELARQVVRLIGRPLRIEIDQRRLRPEKSEVQRLLSDNRLAKEKLDWKPEVDLEDGLKRTIAWIQNNMDIYQPYEYQV